MESSRWKNASLAINAIIRGLDLDHIAFQYDEDASMDAALRARSDDRNESQIDVPVAFADNNALP